MDKWLMCWLFTSVFWVTILHLSGMVGKWLMSSPFTSVFRVTSVEYGGRVANVLAFHVSIPASNPLAYHLKLCET